MILSVITPTYNRGEALAKNLESVQRRSFRGLEHVIIDNLSNDDTRELVEAYQNTAGHAVKYIREPDQGIFHAMNKGIRATTGEWLHFLNSDDIYHPEFSLEVINFKGDMDLIAGSILKGSSLKDSKLRTPGIIEDTGFRNFPHQGLFIRRDFLITHGLYKEKYRVISDTVFALQHFENARYQIIPDIVAFQKDGGITSSGKLVAEKEKLILMFRYSKAPFKRKMKYLSRFLLFVLSRIISVIKVSFYFS